MKAKTMKEKIRYIENVFGFLFPNSFESKFAELGYPTEDLDIWFKNAIVFEKVTNIKPAKEMDRRNLLTLIEAIRFEAMNPPPPGEIYEFDISAYEFTEYLICIYKQLVINEVLAQESR